MTTTTTTKLREAHRQPTQMPTSPLKAGVETLSTLGTLTPPAAVERLVAIKDALPSCGDPKLLHDLARALPAHVSSLSAEVCLALQELALALAPYKPKMPDDILALDTRLATLWLRVQIASGDVSTGLSTLKLDEPMLLHVVTGWSLNGVVTSPLPLLLHLCRASDGRLRRCALLWVEPAVVQLAITPQDAFTCVESLCEDAEVTIRAGAVALLSKCWLRGITPASTQRREKLIKRALLHPHALVRRAAIDATTELGVRRWLTEVILGEDTLSEEDDDAAPPPFSLRSFTRHRAEALEALGSVAEPDDLDMALALASTDPLQFAPRVRSFLLEAHRHGVFVRDHHLDAVLAVFDDHEAFTGEELVRVTHIARAALVRKLGEEADAHPDDPRWIRRASILAASIGTGAHEILARLLSTTKDPRVAAALVDAAGRSPEYEGAALLLRWLDAIPEVVIPVLRVKGAESSDATHRLRAIIDDRFTLRSLRAIAMDALWALSDDRAALLRDLSEQLGPHESGLLESKHLSPRDSKAALLLREHTIRQQEKKRSAPYQLVSSQPISSNANAIDPDGIEPLEQLKIYCESGDIRFLPDVTRLFREVFRDYVKRALAGDFIIKRLLLPELEQLVFRYGRHLVKDGRSVRRWIEDGPETGRDLVLLTVIDWLHEDPSDAVCVALLETASRHNPSGATLRFIEPFWRRGEANVKRAAIEAILAAGAEARGLELSLGKLAADASNPRILTQALEAVRTLRASWAEPIVRAALGRPEMGVKKAAADALAEVGNGNSVPALVKWLASHDNDSFRTTLSRALQRAAGPTFVAVLVNALDQDETRDLREKQLLWKALSGHMSLHVAMRLAQMSVDRERPAHRELVDACLDGRVTLTDASSDQLAAQLHRAQLRTIEPRKDPARRLRLEGFSAEAARELLATRADPKLAPDVLASILAVVRLGLADWIAWIGTIPAAPDPNDPNADEDVRREALTLVLDAAGRARANEDGAHVEHIDVLMDRIEEQLQRQVDMHEERHHLEPETVAGFIERCVAIPTGIVPARKIRAIALTRSLPPSERLGGLRRYRLLGRLGAVRTLRDLEMCLAECPFRPDVAGESATLLFEAFAIPQTVRKEDPPEIVNMHEEARGFYRLEPGSKAAHTWLEAMVKERPLDVPLVPAPLEPPPKPPFKAESRADLDALLSTLNDAEEEQERDRAAARIMDWADARVASSAWSKVLDAYLAGRVELRSDHRARAVGTITGASPSQWPATRDAAAPAGAMKKTGRDILIAPLLSDAQARALIPFFIERWDEGDPHATELLRAVGQERLFPFVVERAKRGSYTLARLLRPSPSPTLAMRSLIDLIAANAPFEVEHLLVDPKNRDGRQKADLDADADPIDPIEGKDLDALVLLIDKKGVEKGLAVRAIHALTEFKERAIDPLARFTTDRRPQVRSAALRALRMVASRERTLQATAQVLKMETRRDVVLGLMASLGHGRHEPSLPGLLERLTDRDYRIRQGAHEALRAWGRDVIPALRHASRRARPDRRTQFAALIAELE